MEGWCEVLDGDASARAIYERHYSAQSALARRRARRSTLFAGPGEKMVLIYADARALFVWRKERLEFRRDKQEGINCAVFRNEGRHYASELILEAETPAWSRWPGERLFTFVDPREVKGNPPGNCFLRAGWTPAGLTKGGLHILEKRP